MSRPYEPLPLWGRLPGCLWWSILILASPVVLPIYWIWHGAKAVGTAGLFDFQDLFSVLRTGLSRRQRHTNEQHKRIHG